jgi:hypothetical protein
LKKDTQLKQTNQVAKEEIKDTNQHLSFSNQISISEAATDSIVSEKELLLG